MAIPAEVSRILEKTSEVLDARISASELAESPLDTR
jgi:hypothetical protein